MSDELPGSYSGERLFFRYRRRKGGGGGVNREGKYSRGEIGAMLLFFMLLKSAILCDLYLLTYIICAIETPCDANPVFTICLHTFFQ